MDYQKIISEIKAKKYQPIYFLAGEEPFFIEKYQITSRIMYYKNMSEILIKLYFMGKILIPLR